MPPNNVDLITSSGSAIRVQVSDALFHNIEQISDSSEEKLLPPANIDGSTALIDALSRFHANARHSPSTVSPSAASLAS